MGKIHYIILSDSLQYSVGCVKEDLCILIGLWLNPFTLQYSPERFRNVQLWGIWRKIKDEQSPFSPFFPFFLDFSSTMNTCIVKDEDGLFGYAFGKLIQIRHDFILSDVFLGSKPMVFIISAYKSEKIQASSLSGRDEYVLILELPAIRYIPLRTDMAFISEEKVYMPFIAQDFKLFQLFFLVFIVLRVGITLWTKPYSFISRTNVFKKRRSVDSLTVRPVAASQFALATRRLCLSFSMALRTESSSKAVSTGLRRCALLVFSPDMPSASKRFCQLYTEAAVQPNMDDISSLLLPVPFNRIAWQRIRNWGLEPFRYPSSKDNR